MTPYGLCMDCNGEAKRVYTIKCNDPTCEESDVCRGRREAGGGGQKIEQAHASSKNEAASPTASLFPGERSDTKLTYDVERFPFASLLAVRPYIDTLLEAAHGVNSRLTALVATTRICFSCRLRH